MVPLRSAFAFASGVAIASCGLFPDTSSLSASDASGSDGARFDVAADVPSAGDGGADAAADVKVSPCTAQHLFCDDFDQGALGAKWDSVSVKSGPLVLSTVNTVTPPNALEATASSSASGHASTLTKHFASANHTHVELDALVVNPGDQTLTEVDFVSFDILSPPAPYTYMNLDLQRWQTAGLLEEYGQSPDAGNTSVDIPISETFNAWKHVTLDLDFTAQTFALEIDGVPITQIALAPQIPQSAFDLSVGVTYTEASKADWNVFIDNVVVDQQ